MANSLASADISSAPDHAILKDASTFDIVQFTYSANPSGAPNGTLDLTLQKHDQRVLLRFVDAHELEVDAGFPHSFCGLEILDTRFLGWDHSQVRVTHYEPAPGIRFWARDVLRVGA